MRAQSDTRLKILLNGHAVETSAATLGQLIEERGCGGSKVATALNGDFVPERARAAARLRSGDRVEIVSARQGG